MHCLLSCVNPANDQGLSRERRAAEADKKLTPTAPIVGCRPLLAGSMVDLPLSKPSCIDAGFPSFGYATLPPRYQALSYLVTTQGKHRSTQDKIVSGDRLSSAVVQRD